MKWFGPAPFAPLCDVAQRAETPTMPCLWCGEVFVATDRGVVLPSWSQDGECEVPYHRECFLRQTFGSVGHQLKACGCYGGTMEDPPELSLREAARLAVEMFTKGTLPPSSTAH